MIIVLYIDERVNGRLMAMAICPNFKAEIWSIFCIKKHTYFVEEDYRCLLLTSIAAINIIIEQMY